MYEEQISNLNKLLSLYSNKIRSNTMIVTKNDLEIEELLHISYFKQNKIIPNISRRIAAKEDNTLPRISTSSTLIGCIQGYLALIHDSINADIYFKEDRKLAHGAYYLYSIPYTIALKPNTKLVYDADITNEIWLVSYDITTKEYKPSSVDQFFTKSILIEPDINNSKLFLITIYIRLSKNTKITDDVTVTPGYHQLTISFRNSDIIYKLEDHKPISAKEYNNNKINQTVLESLNISPFSKLRSW